MARQTEASIRESAKTLDKITARFVNVGGALVTVTHLGEPRYSHSGTPYFDVWECLGCGQRPEVPTYASPTYRAAQEHAERCRAVPMTADGAAPPSAGDELIASAIAELRAEVAELRAEAAARRRQATEGVSA